LGNFVNRIIKFAESRFEGAVPSGGEPGPLEEKLYADIGAGLASLTASLEAMTMRKAAQDLRDLWVIGNGYLTEDGPWTAINTDAERAAVVVRAGLILAALFGRISSPSVPFAAQDILEAFSGAPTEWPNADGRAELDRLEIGSAVKAPPVLFAKVEDAQVTE